MMRALFTPALLCISPCHKGSDSQTPCCRFQHFANPAETEASIGVRASHFCALMVRDNHV